ncbi:MAG: DUF4115 domain-containing protein [Candidatus Omnitrophica bacterium]|nr:DUF4115 domain-containing protein [Candidatus Omnitrophota bacterium]
MKSTREIGELLKNARTKKGLTIEKAYKKTRIHPGILRALEEGRVENLLNKIYIKGFLKKYSEFLGLDKDFIVREYARNLQDETEQKLYIDKDQPPKDIIKYLNIGLSVLAVILFIVFASISISKMKSFFLNRAKKISTHLIAKKDITTKKPIENSAVTPASSKVSLSVKSFENVWIRVKKDGDIVFNGVLPKGSRESWVSDKRFDLRVGKLEALSFTVDSKFIGKIGSGVKNVTIDREGIKIGKKKIR